MYMHVVCSKEKVSLWFHTDRVMVIIGWISETCSVICIKPQYKYTAVSIIEKTLILLHSWNLNHGVSDLKLSKCGGHAASVQRLRMISKHIDEVVETKTTSIRADSRFAPNQWETSSQSNAVSHWLGANLESALIIYYRLRTNPN